MQGFEFQKKKDSKLKSIYVEAKPANLMRVFPETIWFPAHLLNQYFEGPQNIAQHLLSRIITIQIGCSTTNGRITKALKQCFSTGEQLQSYW